jgi:MFS family permease
MSTPKPAVPQPSARILWPVYLFQGTMGLTLGLYVYTYGALIFKRVAAAAGGNDVSLLGFLPLQWTAGIFALGILLETALQVPTGALADGLGRKAAVVGSLLFRSLYFLSLLGLLYFDSAAGVIGCAVTAVSLFAVHYTLQSGSFEAWVTDSFYEQVRARVGRPKLDSAEKEAADSVLARLFTRSETCYWALMLIGTFLGVYLYEQEEVPEVAFLAGAALSLFCAGACGLYMRENRAFAFARVGDLWSATRSTALARMRRMRRGGFRAFRQDPRLWAVFASVAAFTALVYLVDYVVVLFAEKRFPDFFRNNWMTFVAVYTLTSLGANFVLERWLQARDRANRPLGFGLLVWLNAGLNVLFAVPIFAACWLLAGPDTSAGPGVFLALMAAHKLFEAPGRSTGKALQNVLIPPQTEERSTILSWGALFSNVVVAVLVFAGAGQKADDLTSWLWPALAVVVANVVMLGVLLRPRSSPEVPTPRKAGEAVTP